MTIEIYDSSIISKRTSSVYLLHQVYKRCKHQFGFDTKRGKDETGKTFAGVCASKPKEHVALSSNME